MYTMRTLLSSLTLLFFANLVTAQGSGPSLASVAPAHSVAAYDYGAAPATSSSTTVDSEDRFKLYRRERTLFGDLDFSGLWGGPTYNYSSTGDDWALVRGGFGGIEFSETFFLGYGGWKSREDFTTDEIPDGQDEGPRYRLHQGGFIMAFSPGADNLVHPRFTAIVGPGRIELTDNASDRMLMGQLMAGAELNLTQWFRLGFEGGYRFASGVDDGLGVTASDVSGAVLQIEARFGWSW